MCLMYSYSSLWCLTRVSKIKPIKRESTAIIIIADASTADGSLCMSPVFMNSIMTGEPIVNESIESMKEIIVKNFKGL